MRTLRHSSQLPEPWEENNGKETLSEVCHDCREHLGSYMDNDLNGGKATLVAAHLSGCESCQNVYTGLLSVRTALRRLTAPQNSDAARERVFVRLERAARLAEAAKAENLHRRRTLNGWLSAVGSLAAAGMVLTGFIVFPPSGINAPDTDGKTVSGVATTVPLPASAQMTALLEFHDERTATVAETPPAGGELSADEAEKNVPSAGGELASDEVPEAI